MSDSLRPYGLLTTRLLCPWDFPGKNIGVGGHDLEGSFLIQGMIRDGQQAYLRPLAKEIWVDKAL